MLFSNFVASVLVSFMVNSKSAIAAWSWARAYYTWNLFNSYINESPVYKMKDKSRLGLPLWARPVVRMKDGSSSMVNLFFCRTVYLYSIFIGTATVSTWASPCPWASSRRPSWYVSTSACALWQKIILILNLNFTLSYVYSKYVDNKTLYMF